MINRKINLFICALFLGIIIMVNQSHGDSPAPVDVNKPVENPKLVAAIDRLLSDSSNKAKDELLLELNRANFLAAIFTDEMHTSEPDKDGKTVIEKDSLIKVLNTSDADGNTYLPLFTDWKEIKKYIDKPVNTLILPASDAWDWALKMGDYHGIVINPGHNALPLNIEQIKYLKGQSKTE